MAILGLFGIVGCSAPTQQNPMPTQGSIQLSAPEADTAKLIEALQSRHSTREFTSEPLSTAELSGLLWAADGINRPDGKRTAPSALALYPVSIYAFVAEGVFVYNPTANTLDKVAEGDHRSITGMQGFVNDAPLNLVYVADLRVYDKTLLATRKNGEQMSRTDAGCCAQNVNLWAATHGLGAVVRASFTQGKILKTLGLDPKDHIVVLAQSIGHTL